MRSRLIGAAGACVLGGVAVYTAAFDTVAGRRFDATTLSEVIYKGQTLAVPRVNHGPLPDIDLASMLLLGTGVAVLALLRRRADVLVAAGCALAFAGAASQTLKATIGRHPPFGIFLPPGQLTESFPSGHATVAMSLALAVVLTTPGRRARVAALVGGAYATAIGGSLLLQGAHYASDVAAGYLLSAACACLAAAALSRRPEEPPAGRQSAAHALVAAGLAGGVAAAAYQSRNAAPGSRTLVSLLLLAALSFSLAFGYALLLQRRAHAAGVERARERIRPAPTAARSAFYTPNSKPRPAAVSLGDLVAAGLLAADAELTALSRDRNHVAYVRNGAIVVGGTVYPSLSAAARAATGTRRNGWTFWRAAADGKPLPLATLREELRRRAG